MAFPLMVISSRRELQCLTKDQAIQRKNLPTRHRTSRVNGVPDAAVTDNLSQSKSVSGSLLGNRPVYSQSKTTEPKDPIKAESSRPATDSRPTINISGAVAVKPGTRRAAELNSADIISSSSTKSSNRHHADSDIRDIDSQKMLLQRAMSGPPPSINATVSNSNGFYSLHPPLQQALRLPPLQQKQICRQESQQQRQQSLQHLPPPPRQSFQHPPSQPCYYQQQFLVKPTHPLPHVVYKQQFTENSPYRHQRVRISTRSGTTSIHHDNSGCFYDSNNNRWPQKQVSLPSLPPAAFEQHLKPPIRRNQSKQQQLQFFTGGGNQSLQQHSSPPYAPMDIIGKGTYGTVYKSVDAQGKNVALKVIELTEQSDGIPSTVIREISLLKEMCHPNVIRLHRLIPSQTSLVLVFDLADCDLKTYLELYGRPMSERRAKSFLYQMLLAVSYIHELKVLHRDLKPQNLLLTEDGTLLVADFGLARAFSVPVRGYAHQVVTLWYRPPDVLLGNKTYSTGVDMWSIGCIFSEMITGKPVFGGTSFEDHLSRIFAVLGTPSPADFPNFESYAERKYLEGFPIFPKSDWCKLLPHVSLDARDLISRLLIYDGERRITAKAALKHPFFTRHQFDTKIPLRLADLRNRERNNNKNHSALP